MARVQHSFESPSSFDACTNSNVRVVYGREVRPGVRMSGAFCLHRTMQPGEFICAWNGRQVLDDDAVESLTNIYDLSKYALSFPSGRGKQLIYSAPRLDRRGYPARLPEYEADVDDPRDVSLAVFLNEPSPDNVAMYNSQTDTVRIEHRARNSANVCLRTEKQRNGIVCPLMFASRVIRPGEELTWDYGATDYDRRFYTIDEENDVFGVSSEKYSATEAASNVCRVTCESVAFRQGIPLEPFAPDMFLLQADLGLEDRRRIVFRSDRYLPGRRAGDDMTAETASVSSEPRATPHHDAPPAKRQKRRRRLQRRTITVESMQEEEMRLFNAERLQLDQFANDILHRLNAVKKGRVRDPSKLLIIELLKRIVQPAIYWPYEETTAQGWSIMQFFPRVEFVMSKREGEEFVMRENDVIWKDIRKMQNMVFLNIDSTIDALKRNRDTSDEIHLKFAPYTYTSIYRRPDGSLETVEDWDARGFREDHPTAHRIGMRLLRRLAHLQDSIRHYVSWHRMIREFETPPTRGDADARILWQVCERGTAFGEVALDFLERNAHEQRNDTSFLEVCYSVLSTLVDAVKTRPIDAIAASRRLDADRGKLYELRDGGEEADSLFAREMLDILREPNAWRSEGMLIDIKGHRVAQRLGGSSVMHTST